MDRWQSMRIFAEVARHASFAEAARRLHMSAPAVTRAVATLEEHIGTRLLVRSTRSVKLTEPGARYYADCQRILADIAEAEATAAGSFATPSGTLTVTAPAMFGRMYVLPVLTEYLDRYPQVVGRTLFVDRPVNLIEEGVDLAVRIGHLADSALVATRVGSSRMVVVGAPDYLRQHGTPTSPEDLRRFRIAASTAAWASPEWQFANDARVRIEPAMLCNTNDAAINAALAGWGLTRVLDYQVGAALADGRLQILLEDHEPPAFPIHVLHTGGSHAPAKVRAFIDLAVAKLRTSRLQAREGPHP
ncbi:LysR family transcriptional regulator [Novosphingobium sp. SG720]|uniref:LysR substrate-binding domain-containing protein n=1 Tax=Novosphingobium sp. SG720 TaxID=2586998 RepID=UPI0014463035|nr:DNA-binding transcriptional LysR family regulator [Novosphingobium sp. SG720]